GAVHVLANDAAHTLWPKVRDQRLDDGRDPGRRVIDTSDAEHHGIGSHQHLELRVPILQNEPPGFTNIGARTRQDVHRNGTPDLGFQARGEHVRIQGFVARKLRTGVVRERRAVADDDEAEGLLDHDGTCYAY